MKIGVVGSGSFGTAIAVLLGQKGYDVSLWSFLEKEAESIEKNRENIEFLKGVKLPDNVHCTNNLEKAVSGADLVVTVVPSFATRETAKKLSPYIKDGQIMVNLSKGLENGSLLRLSQVYSEEIPQAVMAVMSGPSHAEEVAIGLPTTNVVASENIEAAKLIQDIFMSENFRVYLSDDAVGVELGGALKNVIALCAGICDGLGFGDNTKAALMTRGIAEIKRLGIAMGAKPETVNGLTGVGDLIVTCQSKHSRNRKAGELMGQGMTMDQATKEVKMVVEGVYSAKAALALGKKYYVQIPIIEEVNKVLFEDKSAKEAVYDLMLREKRVESNSLDWK